VGQVPDLPDRFQRSIRLEGRLAVVTTYNQSCLYYGSKASCGDIDYNHSRVVELLGPG
jgi:hypothetical protein